MITFQRLSAGPTIPDLIRQVADRQAYQSLQILPKEVWCRRAAIAIVWHHRNNIIQHPSAQAGAAQRKPLSAYSMHKFVGQRMDPSLAPHCSLQASSRAIVRSQRVMMQVSPAAETIHSWSNRQLAKVFSQLPVAFSQLHKRVPGTDVLRPKVSGRFLSGRTASHVSVCRSGILVDDLSFRPFQIHCFP